MAENDDAERLACIPVAPQIGDFNNAAQIPFGVRSEHLLRAMLDFTEFLGAVNGALYGKKIARLESILMPAGFSSMVGEFIGAALPRHSPGVVKNRFHNGHPDLLEVGKHKDDAAQHHDDGIEIKASRYPKGWQGHNAEGIWLMVIVFSSGRPTDAYKKKAPKPFRFLGVFGAQLTKEDWSEAPRGAGSRRTATASVTRSGFQKMTRNWIYRVSDYATAFDEEEE